MQGLHEPSASTVSLSNGLPSNQMDRKSLVGFIKSCQNLKDLKKARRIVNHDEVYNSKDIHVSAALLSLYSKCGEMGDAQKLFDILPVRDLVTWNTLINGFSKQDSGHNIALKCYKLMCEEAILPDAITFSCLLKASSCSGDLLVGKEIHAMVISRGLLRRNIILGTALVDMYAKCNVVRAAEKVFDELLIRNVISWNAMISGFSRHELFDEALFCFRRMQDEGISPNLVTFLCVIKACVGKGSLEIGEEIHSQVMDRGFLLEKDMVLGTALVDMYAKCGVLKKAQEVFNELLPRRDVVSFNALIAGYARHGLIDEALDCLKKMKLEKKCVSPNALTFVSILKACGAIGSLEKGEKIHAEVEKRGLIEKSKALGPTLVDMYVNCSELRKAQEVFDRLQVHDVISWSALISGYARHGLGHEALTCFRQMQSEGIHPDQITYICVLKACCSIGDLHMGEEIHKDVKKQGLLEKNIELGNMLVNLYAKCGSMEKAQEVFNGLSHHDLVGWNTLMVGYAQHGFFEESLNCLWKMRDEGISPDAITYCCGLKACGSIGSLKLGEEISAEVSHEIGSLQGNIMLESALVDMYAKCSMLEKAQDVFRKIQVRDIVSWSLLMAGYAQLGQAQNVFYLFKEMVSDDNIAPDIVTFLVLLMACSHAGLMDEGQRIFDDMGVLYGIFPTSKHYTSMVDLFGRAGHFGKAVSMLEMVQSKNRFPLLLALLGACCKWANVKLGKWVFDQLVESDKKCGVAYVCMRNMYSASGMHVEANKVETLRWKNEAWDTQGHCWWNDINVDLSI